MDQERWPLPAALGSWTSELDSECINKAVKESEQSVTLDPSTSCLCWGHSQGSLKGDKQGSLLS